MKLPTSGDGHRTLPALTRSELKYLQSSAGEAAALLKVLSNEKRLLILCTLAGGELSVSDLNERIGELLVKENLLRPAFRENGLHLLEVLGSDVHEHAEPVTGERGVVERLGPPEPRQPSRGLGRQLRPVPPHGPAIALRPSHR